MVRSAHIPVYVDVDACCVKLVYMFHKEEVLFFFFSIYFIYTGELQFGPWTVFVVPKSNTIYSLDPNLLLSVVSKQHI